MGLNCKFEKLSHFFFSFYFSSGVVYLLSCKVCGMQYVGSTFTPFRARFNNYKSCSRRFDEGELVNQADFFRHFSEVGHRGFLKDVTFQVVDTLFGDSKAKEGFWQFKLDSFIVIRLLCIVVDSQRCFQSLCCFF